MTPEQPAAPRFGEVTRTTKETDIAVAVDLDGGPNADISTGIGFFDHMLDQIARHARIGLRVRATGDLHIDDHHTVEDVGIAIGKALDQAVGDKAGIRRYAHSLLPMDEALTQCALDLSGRPFLAFRTDFGTPKIGTFDTQLVREFFTAVAMNGRMTLHIETLYGENDHHIAESCFKAFARALGDAVAVVSPGELPSTKGAL